MRSKTCATFAAFTLLSLATAGSPALAFDLTGTWAGKWSCKGFDGEKFTTSNKNSTLRITQTGGNLAAELDNGDYHYNGGAIPDAAKPEKGEIVFDACANDNLPLADAESEIVRAAVKTKAGTFKASLKGTSIFEDNFGGVGSCKYTFKRLDVVNPNIAGCVL